MNGIEKITDRIAQDTQAEVEACIARGQEEASRILSDYASRAQRERDEILAKGRRDREERQARLDSMAQMELRKSILAAKQDVVSQAFDLALKKLCALPEEEMVPLLARLAADSAVTGTEQLVMNPAQREAYGQKVVDAANSLLENGCLTLGPGNEEIEGGLLLRSGSVDVNCTFEMLVRLHRSKTSGEVAQVLFPRG